MRVLVVPYCMQKLGNRESEYEDACWPEGRLDQESACVRLAVADGATESCFAARWARALVKAAGEGLFVPGQTEELGRLQKDWQEWVKGQSLPWYLDEKAAQGAFASLLLLVLEADGNTPEQGCWHASAIGDSCVVQVRGDRLLTAFPITRSGEFGNRPFLLGTRSTQADDLAAHLHEQSGTWQANDSFFLMTDALACWFLREVEDDRKPWNAIHGLDGESAFQEWIDGLRANDGLRNDDTTLLAAAIV